jgi:pyruvate/2-oxoglutarate dehydrogenase complex dihydrolipoamide acyltransferase (E2) component
LRASRRNQRSPALLAEASAWRVRCLAVGASKAAITTRPLAAAASVPTATTVPTTAVTTVVATEKSVKNTHESFSFRKRQSHGAAVGYITISRNALI